MLTCTCIFNGDLRSNSYFHVHLSYSVKWPAFFFTITSIASLGLALLAGGQSWFFLAGAKDKNTRSFTFAPLFSVHSFLNGQERRPCYILPICVFVFCPITTYRKMWPIFTKVGVGIMPCSSLQGWYTYLSGDSNRNLHLRFHSCGLTVYVIG